MKLDEARTIRSDIVLRVADEFERSGIAYTCLAVVNDFARPRVAALRTNHQWPMRSIFGEWSMTRAVGDVVHARWRERRDANH